MGLAIRPLRHPALMMRTISRLVSNESADATDGKQRLCDERLSHRSGMRLTSGLCAGFFKRQTLPPSFTRRTANRHAVIWRKLRWILIGACSRLWNWGTPQFHSNNLLASNTRERGGCGSIALCMLHADCRRRVCTQSVALEDPVRAFPSADSRYRRRAVRREQHHDPGMEQTPAVREAESFQ